jgi:hypothetical protein
MLGVKYLKNHTIVPLAFLLNIMDEIQFIIPPAQL